MEVRDFWVELKLGRIGVDHKGIRTDKILIRKELFLTGTTDLMENWPEQMAEMSGHISRALVEAEQEVKHLRGYGTLNVKLGEK